MADINQQATVNIEINSESAKHKIADLENKLADLNKKKKEFEKAGDYRGLAKVQKDLDSANRKLHNARTNAQKCEAALKKLNSASPKELRMTLRQLQNDLNYIERGSKAWHEHVQAIKRVKAEINAVDAELVEHQSLLQRANGFVNKWGMSIASVAASFTGLVFTARQAVEAYADMDAEMASVQKFTGMTADQVAALNEEFKKMDTRTSREELNKLAQEAGRLGLQTQEDVLGFVKAADVINIALDDLGEGATLTISKLTDIFGAKEMYGVEQSMLKVGSVINELSQSCTASAPYLADFAQRLAGVGKQANMTIPEIMGLAAVLDSNGQAVEMSATAVSQLIMKMFKDPAKIAQATGLSLQEFSRVLKEDTNQALIMLLEQLNSLGNLDVLAPVFAAMGTDGARASQVIAALAGNINMVKQQQQAATSAFRQGNSVIKEFNVQNNTAKANLDKAKKGFNEVAVALGQKLAPAMKHIVTGTSALMRILLQVINFVSKYAGTIISLTTAIGGYIVVVNASIIADKLKVFWNEKVLASFKNLWKIIVANPYAALAAAIGFVIGLIIDLTRATNAEAEAEATLNDIRKTAAENAAEEQMKIETLMATANNMTIAYEDQYAACAALNKLIPNFNGKIDAQSRKFTYSAKALSDYCNQLMRLYELEGAREKLKELGRRRAEKTLEIAAIQEELKNEPVTNGNFNYSTSQGNGAPAAAHMPARRSALAAQLVKANQELKGIDAGVKAIQKQYGADMYKQDAGPKPETPTSNITGGGGGGGGGKNSGTGGKHGGSGGNHRSGGGGHTQTEEEKKRQQEVEKRKRQQAILEKKEFKDAFELLKSHRINANAAALDSYRKGEIDYEAYLKKLHAASEEYYTNAEALFKKHEISDSEEAAKMKDKRIQEQEKYYSDLKQLQQDALADERDNAQIKAEMDFYDHRNQAAYKNEEYRDAQLAKIGLEYHEKMLALETEGTKEYYEAERALDKAIKEEELRQRVALEEHLQEWLNTYSLMGAKFRKKQELAVLDQYYKAGKIKKEQYEEAKRAIEKKYRDMVDDSTGTHGNQMDDAEYERDTRLNALEKLHDEGLISEESYQSRRYQIIKAYHDQVKDLVSSEGNEWATMLVDLQENWKNVFENLGSTIPEILENIGDAAAATFAIMGAGLQSYSNYANAQRDLEIAQVTKSYDEQIKAAGNNEKKTKKLEEKKQAEIAKLKTKYNKRAQNIEIAQAIASTALAAINAFASASKVSFILGPIAAAMATAAGAIQIATIRKQHQAEAEGYYEGGFTARDRNNRREVGVVHANEFVANHEAVANKQLAPVFRLIDQAQRNNTVGSLTSEDVSRAIGQGSILGEMTSNQQRSLTEREASMALVAAAMEQQSAAIVELNRRLEQGIESFMVMDGERGFEKYWENYKALKERPRR